MLNRAALVEMIDQPARRAGLTFDPPTLPQRMAADTGGGDALPLLAYALQELCLTAGSGGVLTADTYQRIGGVSGVLTRQADKVAAELGGADKLVLSTLLKFVTIGENERDWTGRGTYPAQGVATRHATGIGGGPTALPISKELIASTETATVHVVW
jgi:Novel STAND NTPase 1